MPKFIMANVNPALAGVPANKGSDTIPIPQTVPFIKINGRARKKKRGFLDDVPFIYRQ